MAKKKPSRRISAKMRARPKKSVKKRIVRKKKASAKGRADSRVRKSAGEKAKTTVAKRASSAPSARPSKPNVAKTAVAEEKTETPVKAPRTVTKVLPRNFLVELCQAIRDAVLPAIKSAKGREIVGTATSGDATFELDRLAEKALLSFLKNAKLPVAYYSEDAGYTTFTNRQPKNLIVVDPIDGTRAAKCGFESCVVSVCSTRVIERPTVGDVDNGCILEIMGDRMFCAERGKGARVYVDGHSRKVRRSQNANLETVSWAMTVPARPAELIFPTAARLIDLTSLKGGFFACNSSSFSLTRLLTNQLDACVDFANRYYRDIPSLVEDSFINAGRGIILGICPYDFAAAHLIAKEGQCVVTDAYGNGLDDVLLLDSSVANQRSLIAASNAELHEKLMSFFDTRIKQFEELLKKRSAAASAS